MATKNRTQPKKECVKCKRMLNETNFYKCDNSPLFPDGRFHMCAGCLGKLMEEDDGYEVALMALHSMNKPMLTDTWNDAPNGRDYFRQINSLPNYRGLTWKNSDHDEVQVSDTHNEKLANQTQKKQDIIIDDDVIERYGIGYTDEEYKAFERKYRKLTKNYTEQTSMHSEGLVTYIRYRVKEEMATARGESKESKEWGKLASDAAKDAKLNVSQLSKSDISGGVDLMTQLGEAVETKVSVIPVLPKVLAQPYDDADLIMWATVNYNRRLEDKPPVDYRDIYKFYDDMLEEHFTQKDFTPEEIEMEKQKRNNVFRDLGDVYKEPLYDEGDA